MRFLVDECTGRNVGRWLKGEGHEVFSVFEEARGMKDEAILQKAADEDWIIITNDKGFGEQVFRDKRAHQGIVLLRLSDERSRNKIEILQKLLSSYANQIVGKYVVVTESRVRFADR